jgi:hypothetical protein
MERFGSWSTCWQQESATRSGAQKMGRDQGPNRRSCSPRAGRNKCDQPKVRTFWNNGAGRAHLTLVSWGFAAKCGAANTKTVENAKPGLQSDGDRRILTCAKNGGRWTLRFQLNDRRRDMGPGSCPAMSRAPARKGIAIPPDCAAEMAPYRAILTRVGSSGPGAA